MSLIIRKLITDFILIESEDFSGADSAYGRLPY